MVWVVVIFFSEPKKRYYLKYGYFFALIFLVFELILIFLIFPIMNMGSVFMFLMIVLNTLKIIVFTVVGMFMAGKLGVKSIPLTRQLFSRSGKKYIKNLNNYVITLVVSVILVVGYSIVLFKLTHPHISEFISDLGFGSQGSDIEQQVTLTTVIAMAEIAFAEEIMFRHGIQNVLANIIRSKNNYFIAIILTSLFWSLMHILSLDPAWVKLVQIFPIGILLGFLYKKYGFEICVLVHALFNIIVSLIAEGLVEY